MVGRRQIIHGDLGTAIHFYDTMHVHHPLHYWNQHYKHHY